MSAAASPPVIPSASAAGIESNDPLGYDAYAKTLWTRIDHALNRDATTGELGDDPLVVGLFGEWGVGKTYLLQKIRDQAKARSKVLAEWHRSDGGFDLLIPVYFQPWKYEHEEHLHVPLLLHTLKALEEGVKAAQTFWDRVGQGAQKPGDAVIGALDSLVSGFTKLFSSTAIAMEPATQAALATAKFAAEATAENAKRRPKKTNIASALRYSADGRYYYDIHNILKGVTRPAKHPGALPEIVILNENFKVNFVVFVDDLDRCLPEKAVQVLELIKTVFNVESFAFVLALDDEVIERGIGHRYKDYTFENKKPQMPITGFEYLEKIVHLPFRLPALTQEQAIAFVRFAEERAEANPSLRWFAELPLKPESTEEGVHNWNLIDSVGSNSSLRATLNEQATRTHLLSELLASFDAFVPRKLLRAVELWHQVCRVARERGIAPAESTGTRWPRTYDARIVSIDIRVVFALMLLQLFQPELFRFMRRRSEAFPVMLRAFSGVTVAKDGLNKIQVSEVDLWSWASFRRGEADPDNIERPCTEADAVKLIARLSSEDAYQAQHIRLRIAERLVEHFAVQRHVFNPLRLMHWLAGELESSQVASFADLPSYFAVLSQQKFEPITAVVGATDTVEGTTAQAAVFGTPTIRQLLPSFSLVDPEGLFNLLAATDTAARGGISERFALPSQRVLDDAAVSALTGMFSNLVSTVHGGETSRESQGFDHVIGAVAPIAPWLGWEQGGKRIVATVAGAQDDDTTSGVIDKLLNQAPTPKSRAAIGDLLERFPLGDPRFDRARFQLPFERFHQETENEPIIGFVRIPGSKTPFQMGHVDEPGSRPTSIVIKDDFYMARTLTTVDQYGRFAKEGYNAGIDIWGKQGLAWREGLADFKVSVEKYTRYLSQRAAPLRKAPWNWADQQAHGSRPVTGVTWFEARAYARWLNIELKAEMMAVAALKGYEVRLPAEAQWERAARGQSLTAAHSGRWPWGDDETKAPHLANIEGSNIGTVSSVGVFLPNKIGLCDMSGNACQWMDNIYVNPPDEQFWRVPLDNDLITAADLDKCDRLSLRGGSWVDPPGHASCSDRQRTLPYGWGEYLGFRVALSLAQSEN